MALKREAKSSPNNAASRPRFPGLCHHHPGKLLHYHSTSIFKIELAAQRIIESFLTILLGR